MNTKGGRMLAIRYLLALAAIATFAAVANASLVINEIDYDQDGTDDVEYVELYGTPGMSLTGWQLVLYNGNGGVVYATIDLSVIGTVPADGFVVVGSASVANVDIVSFTTNGIQNGAPDGMALVSGGGSTVVELLSYEGTFSATDGPASGMNLPDIGVADIDPATGANEFALQRIPNGTGAWTATEGSARNPGTPGVVNPGDAATGACCETNASCTPDTTQLDCEAGGGTWQGADSVCTPNPCGAVGACCSPDYSCTNNLTEPECIALDPTATWYEGEFCSLVCGPTGACCGLDGVCVADVTEAQCTAMQGNSWTEGVGCGSMSCAVPTQAAVIVSEYYESAPGNRKAIELWNTTANTISLNGHAIAATANDSMTPTAYFFLDDLQIGPYGTLVLVNDVDDIANEIAGLDEAYAIEAPNVVNFNGDDAFALMFGDVALTPTILDAFAVPGQRDSGPRGADPYIDAAWERDCSITVGTADFDACNFDGLKECALAECPNGTPVDPVCTDGAHANEWVFEGRNLAADNGNHSLGSHLCVAGVGACCDGANCVLTDSASCAGLGGTFYADTPCNPLPCGPTGACCVANVSCVDDVTESECRAYSADATWYNGGACAVDCQFSGACCLASNPGTPCACPGDMDLNLAVDLADVPLFVDALLGLGSQACADANGDTFVNGLDIPAFVDLVLAETTCQCAIVTAAECAASGGTYQGDGTTCEPNPCGSTGACCAADLSTCTDDLTVEECTALSATATWYDGQTCAEACVPAIPEGLVINEFWADDGLGDTAEYIELYCPSCGGVSLNGLSLIIVEGDATALERRVNNRFDLTGYTMPASGYFLIGSDSVTTMTGQTVDLSFDLGTSGAIQNGAQTFALVLTNDIAYDVDTQQLSAASIAAITANLVDGVAIVTSNALDVTYFGVPVLGPNGDFTWDVAARIPNGADTNSDTDWATMDTFPLVIELYDANDLLSTPGYANTLTILGVCCDGTSTCDELTKADCEDGDPVGGVWQGRYLNENCSNPNVNPCLPVGACCMPDTSCLLANEDVCVNTLGGTYRGDDSVCDPNPCTATGSCCLPGSICYDDVTESECTALGAGVWTMAGTCATGCGGACCTSTGCVEMSRNACLALDPQGVFLGAGTTCATSTCPPANSCLIISEVVDGDMPGGTPKWVEITNTGSSDYTFAAGGLIAQANASTDTAVDVDLTGVTIPAGTSYVICNSANLGDAVFLDVYGFDANLYSGGFWGANGDDRYAISDVADGSHIIDIYGTFGVDGTGMTWEFTDSFAERNFDVSNGNGGTFDEANWYIAGVASLDGAGDDALAKALLQNNTTPGVHNFTPCAREIVECTGGCTATQWCQYQVVDPGDCGSLSFSDLICIQCQGDCPGAGTEVVFTWVDGNGAGSNCTFTAQSIEATTACKGSCSGVHSFEDVP